MWPYWFVFGLASLTALTTSPPLRLRRDRTRAIRLDPAWIAVIAGLTLMMGFRYRVGGDWFAYIRMFEQAHFMTFEEAALRSDPGYWLLNFFVAQAGGTMVAVNLWAGLAFSVGVVVFCRSLPRPWLAFAVAFPYLILVVGMGYARQGIALGFVMIAMVALGRRRFVWFILWIIVGALFHKSAVVMMALGAASVNRSRWLWLPIIGLGTLGAYLAFMADDIDRLIAVYITAQYESGGALIRLGMNLIPAVLLLFLRRRFLVSHVELRFWTVAALVSVGLFGGLMVGVMTKRALITGITGQDGSYLGRVPCWRKAMRFMASSAGPRCSTPSGSITSIEDPHTNHQRLKLHYGDLTDSSNLTRILSEVQPDEVYNLGAQSMSRSASKRPNTPPMSMPWARCGCWRRSAFWLEKKTRFYQASTSELYGLVQETRSVKPRPSTRVRPMRWPSFMPTGSGELPRGLWHLCLQRHPVQSREPAPRRDLRDAQDHAGLANIAQGLGDCLYMGNIDSLRDWGHAKDYVRMQWMMLQQDAPEDFVIATGVQYSVREFITWSARELGIDAGVFRAGRGRDRRLSPRSAVTRRLR
jgi:GDP-D-mannose dehydratase